MSHFEKLRAEQSVVEDLTGENLVRNHDFSTHKLEGRANWGTMSDMGDNSWYAESGLIEVQKSAGHRGTPSHKVKTTVLELDALKGKKGLGATNSNATVSQELEAIDGPGTFRVSLDFMGRSGKKGVAIDETSSAEIWLGDKLVTTLTAEDKKWREKVVEIELEDGEIPEDGAVLFRMVSTGVADGRGINVDNVSVREIGDTGLIGEELITNGSFEADAPGRGTAVLESIEGWTVSDESVFELRSVRKPTTPREKNDTYIELDSHGADSNSRVAQDIEVMDAGTYLLSFDYSPRAKKGVEDFAGTSGLKVLIGDTVVAEISSDSVGWRPFTYNLDLVEGPIKLAFEGTGVEDTHGALLDNVVLRRVGDMGPDATPLNAVDETAVDPAQDDYASGLFGEVFFSDTKLRHLDQAIDQMDDNADATFTATKIDYGSKTGWFHTPLDFVLEHDADSISDGADLGRNFNHAAMKLTGEIYLEAGTHTFYKRPLRNEWIPLCYGIG